jgi:hypothetical protein
VLCAIRLSRTRAGLCSKQKAQIGGTNRPQSQKSLIPEVSSIAQMPDVVAIEMAPEARPGERVSTNLDSDGVPRPKIVQTVEPPMTWKESSGRTTGSDGYQFAI